MKTTVHIISHSHWDREWYQSFESHRMKLIELVDNILDKAENDPEFGGFFLDGQVIAIDDYLEIRPEKRAQVEKCIREGKVQTGPWYILQDEFLTSGEACVRNLQVGMQEAEQYGAVGNVGYFPDAFGNAGQMPQVLKQAGMDAVVFGRGVKPIGPNNEVTGGQYESTYSEMMWASPDGTKLPGILFANWYNNGVEIPVDEAEAKVYWDKKLADARKFAATHQLLMMNGCDHQPLQKNITEAIRVARKLYPDVEFIHSDFKKYVEAMEKEISENFSTVKGELTSQETDGRWTLANTASSWIGLKQDNRAGETALERKAEPAAAMADVMGKAYPEDQMIYSWKKLMQNHPHDSICGCSVDEVNEEMKTRFAKSRQVADAIYDESVEYLTNKVNTAALPGDGEKIPFVVWNTSGETKSQVVEKELHLFHDYNLFVWDGYEAAEKVELPAMVLRDADGNVVPAKIADAGVAFGYDLPDDRFRQPYMAKKVLVTFEAEVPALGYRTYYLETAEQAQDVDVVSADENVLENDAVKVVVNADGSYNLLDKKTGRMYENLGFYEDTGDMGNEYIYIQDSGKQVVSTKGMKAEISCVERNAFRTVVEICHKMMVPSGMGEELLRQREMCIDPYTRVANRSSELVEMDVKTVLTLEKSAKGLRVATTICNQAKDHRVRVILPTGLDTSMHMADSAFEVVRRNNRHNDTWTNPCGCERQQCFVAMEDAKGGLLVANRGLYEYEILEDQGNAVAVTLLRCVAEMGDWGYFPTPKAQQIGTFCLEFEVVPFAAGETGDAFREGYAFQEDLTVEQAGLERTFLRKPGQVKPELVEGELPLEMSFLAFEGDGIHMTAFKKGQKKDDLFVRFVNNMEHEEVLSFKKEDWMKEVYRSNVIEEKGDLMIPDKDGVYHVALREFEIATFGIVK
ncbi:alpha-mannosidase [Fusicatenibacter saccharivorans]|uniref:alpha-mannosidase n=1 Tax=Fusicatenibacter saccharivorans TaxID=1150298 RepID=UPI0032BF8846